MRLERGRGSHPRIISPGLTFLSWHGRRPCLKRMCLQLLWYICVVSFPTHVGWLGTGVYYSVHFYLYTFYSLYFALLFFTTLFTHFTKLIVCFVVVACLLHLFYHYVFVVSIVQQCMSVAVSVFVCFFSLIIIFIWFDDISRTKQCHRNCCSLVGPLDALALAWLTTLFAVIIIPPFLFCLFPSSVRARRLDI